MDYLLRNAYFPFQNTIQDIGIRDGQVGKIYSPGEDTTYYGEYENIVNLENRLVIPGFVDAHTHLDKVLIGNKVVNKSGTLQEAIQLMMGYKNQMTSEEVAQRARQAIEQSIRKGTRFIRTHVDIDDQIKLTSLEALVALREEYKASVEIQLIAFPQQGINENEQNLYYLEEALKIGADLIGGIPAQEENPREHIRKIFDLAVKYDKDIDMHIDETDDPTSLTIKDLLEFTVAYGYQGRVSAGHLCSLAAFNQQEIYPIVEKILEAKVNVISLPSTNLYLQGRGDERKVRRGIAPIKYFHEENVTVMIASDNNQDPFNPFGNFNMLEEALVAAHGAHMGGEYDLEALFDMITVFPGKALKFHYYIEEGQEANFIILDTSSKSKAIIRQSDLYASFLNGQLLNGSL